MDMEWMATDDKTRDVIKNRINAANELANEYQSGGQGLLKPFEPTKIDLGEQAMSAAIKGRANQRYQDEIDRIRTLQQYKQPLEAMRGLKQAQGLAAKEYQLDRARQMALQKRVQDEDTQRAQVLSSLLGLGAVAGGAALGGPMGAAAGGAVAGAGQQAMQPRPAAGQSYKNYSNMA